MTVVWLQITAYLAHSSSLKDKRSAVKRLCAQLRREYGASVCEDGLQDNRQWMQLGMAMACADMPTAQRMMPVSYTHLDVYKRQIGRRRQSALTYRLIKCS